MDDLTDFEKKLAEQIPQLRRNVKDEILTAMNQPIVWLKLQIVQNTFQKTLQYHWQQIQSLQKYVVVGICCFCLGALVMYGVTVCSSENCQHYLCGYDSTQTNGETVRYETILLPITSEFLDDVNGPIEFLRKIPQQKIVRLTSPKQEPTQYQILREFQK
jgi:hypothetical protein